MHTTRRHAAPWFLTIALGLAPAALYGCGGSDPATPDAALAADAASGSDAASGDDTGPASTALHGCEESDFIDLTTGPADSRMVMVPRGTTRFDFPCITIRAGQAVMFMWDFAAHPLAPGVAPGQTGMGTEPSPIEPQSTGELYEPVFPTAGDYPYYCTLHHGAGMVGVVRVLP